VVSVAPADFKITADGIAALQDAIELIEPGTAQRDVVGGLKTTATGSIASLIQSARAELNRLDGLIDGLEDDNETDFIKGYLNVRKVNDRRGAGKQTDKGDDAQNPSANAA
jgi:hypothetical protein